MGVVDDQGAGLLRKDIDHLVISLRAYVPKKPAGGSSSPRKQRGSLPATQDQSRPSPRDWVLVFDCETNTTPDQGLRFGAYQLRHRGELFEHGIFYEPRSVTASELDLLKKVMLARDGAAPAIRTRVLTRADFIDQVFYDHAYSVGAQIVGFNLPFDLSRLALRHVNARRAMLGGFSLILSDSPGRPPVAVKHISRSAAFIRFAGLRSDAKGSVPGAGTRDTIERGYFVDVKTLAAALTSTSHSLESLSQTLLEKPKRPSEEHGGPLTTTYVEYAIADVQATWECYSILVKRLADLGLRDTGPWQLYSEASLGKGYLRAMGIRGWRDVQPNFPREVIGKILCAYFGGRAEVHVRRQIVPVIHCDFLSMYPTVCTLMGLWRFVCAQGIIHSDDTGEIRDFLSEDAVKLLQMLQKQDAWRELTAIVQVRPQKDLFPVRAQYAEGEPKTIGLNYLTSGEPLWFTLADVLVSKILTGRTPEVVQAIRFRPKNLQDGLRPIQVAGRLLDPQVGDFYRELIVERRRVRARQKKAPEPERTKLETDQLNIKILANSTSYGAFVELNVEESEKRFDVEAFGPGDPFVFKSHKWENPGRFFHPLLATLITGAARLMLALAEKQVLDRGLDWAFCDTDSMAIANVGELPLQEFKRRALAVVDWFRYLNPYGEDAPILQLEKVNFPAGKDGLLEELEPPFCLAVSAKRYVLFNRVGAQREVRKASGHGLGHLLAPYDEPGEERRTRIARIGVPLWQEDLWKAIIRAAESDAPDEVDYSGLRQFDQPAGSQYAATTPELLKWFEGYNERHPNDPIRPFGFLLSLFGKSEIEMAIDDPDGLRSKLWFRRRPRPAAPFFRSTAGARGHAFDREFDEPIPDSWLETYGRNLARYHLHPEAKFIGADYDQLGILHRRHVRVLAVQVIGKESDNVGEAEFIGNDADPIAFDVDLQGRASLISFLERLKCECNVSNREICSRAGVSHHTLSKLEAGGLVSQNSVFALVRAAEELRSNIVARAGRQHAAKELLNELSERSGGHGKIARKLGISRTYLGRVISGERPVPSSIMAQLEDLKTQIRVLRSRAAMGAGSGDLDN